MKPVPEFIPFGGPAGQAPRDTARILVLPLCYESAPSYGEGSGAGPMHLLYASSQMEHLDEETGRVWPEDGIHTILPPALPSEPEAAVEAMEKAAAAALATGAGLLALGGDHAVTTGCVAAAAKLHPGLGVLQVDAHTDLRDEWNGSRYNHACTMRRIADDMGLPFVQVGIRSVSVEEGLLIRERGYEPFYAHAIAGADPEWMDRAIARLPEKVYLTLDLDGLDPSEVPGTGTPEPGGLRYREVVELIRRLGAAREVVAADVNELAVFAGSQVSEYIAARLGQKICHLALARRKGDAVQGSRPH